MTKRFAVEYVQKPKNNQDITGIQPPAKRTREYIETICQEDEQTHKLLDRPNTLRLLELSPHTSQLFGHAWFFSDIFLQFNHQY